MIPKNITRNHVIQAIEEINKFGISSVRHSSKFILEYNGKFYLPKYVILLANKFANGKELNPKEFNGGIETNSFLKRLGLM